jgi:cysteine desulfurase
LERELLDIEATGLNGEGSSRVPNTTNIYFDGIEGEALVIALDLKGTGSLDRRRLLLRSHRTIPRADRDGTASGPCERASIRFSLGKQNTPRM